MEEALKLEVNDEEKFRLFNSFLKDEVAPYAERKFGLETAVLYIADMIDRGCTAPSLFREVEVGEEFGFKFPGVIRMIKRFMQDTTSHLRQLEVLYKKAKCASVTKVVAARLTDLNMTRINEIVRDVVDEKVASIKYTIRLPSHEVELTSEYLDEFVKSGRDKLQITAQNEQKGFSLYTQLSDALTVCGDQITVFEDVDVRLLFDAYNLEPDDETRQEEIMEEIQHARTTLAKLAPVAPLAVQGLEATSRLYIDPVLLASARIVGEIKLYVEKKISGKRANGPVDYVFIFNKKIICVTEAKYQKLKEGLAQNVAQMAVVREIRGSKRKIDFISQDEGNTSEDESDSGSIPIYGIATTAKSWIFSLLQDDQLRISDTIDNTTDEQLTRVVALVAGLLTAGKK